MEKITYDIEWNLERSHWWFVGRRKLLKSLLSSLNIQRGSPIIDIGCGVGSNLTLLGSMNFKAIGIDLEIYSLLLAQKCHSGVTLVNGDLLKLPIKSNSINLIIATDILEHLDEDSMGIREIHGTLIQGGKAIITIPAFKFLWGVQDVVGMHKRRYSKKEFKRKMEQEGFTILKLSYFNFILFFPIFFARRVIRLLGLRIESENKMNSPLINFCLKTIFSLEPYILKYCSFPFGVSIYCIAKK
jgi:ubiquinone/menaquinone biosynthesis C-methylase UbiE